MKKVAEVRKMRSNQQRKKSALFTVEKSTVRVYPEWFVIVSNVHHIIEGHGI